MTETKGPWIDEAGFICRKGENGINYPMYELVQVVGGHDVAADRALIVRAVNSMTTPSKGKETP